MGAASWNRPDHGQDVEQDAADTANSVSSPDPPPNEAIWSWLVRGIHTVGIDPRRLGGRGHARRVLGEDRRLAPGAGGGWRDLASALQRHTIHNALTHLSAEERHVVNLAYLEGRTNRQIAAMLGVSVSTVRRRLWFALEHLDEYVRRTGTWVSAILLLGVVYVIDRWARLGRLADGAASPEWQHKLVASVAVGSVAAAGVGFVAANLASSSSRHSAPPATARLIPSLPGATLSSMPNLSPFTPATVAPITPITPITESTAAALSRTTVTKATNADSDAIDEESEQGDSASEQSDEADDASPVITLKSNHKARAPQTGQHGVIHESQRR